MSTSDLQDGEDAEMAAVDQKHDAQQDETIEATEQARLKTIFRQLDRRIIPPFWLLYFLCSAVRSLVGLSQTMNTAQGQDLKTVIDLSPQQVSTGLALFYATYVVFEVPSNLVMSKVRPQVWLARIVISVGIIGIAMVGMKNAAGFYVLRLLLGAVQAGMWPGMSLYMTLFYPPQQMAKRVGYYFTASQVSAAVVGLVSAGFQEMDGVGGLVGFRWMFLLWGIVTFLVGLSLLWWLPARPLAPNESPRTPHRLTRWIKSPEPILTGSDAQLHYSRLRNAYNSSWTWHDLVRVLVDWRFWPLCIMYFGVVGVGNGITSYGTVILSSINPAFSGIDLSLLYAPIWICDLVAILLITPISDRFHRHRALLFSLPVLLQIAGLLIATYAGDSTSQKWGRYVGLLMVGFGLGPTVPITMAWTAQIFQARHGEIGVAAATALVSGLGNCGSILTNYALYAGWSGDEDSSPPFEKSNWAMIAILLASIAAAGLMQFSLRWTDSRTPRLEQDDKVDKHDERQ